MNEIVVALLMGMFFGLVALRTGHSTIVKRICEGSVIVSAFAVIFLVGVLSGIRLRELAQIIEALGLSLFFSIATTLSSLVAALPITRLYVSKASRQGGDGEGGKRSGSILVFTPLRSVLVLVTGWVIGFLISEFLPYAFVSNTLTHLVAVLVFAASAVIAFEARGFSKSQRLVVAGIVLAASTMLVSGLSAAVLSLAFGIPFRVGMAIGSASGWYSLAGPLLAKIDPLYGIIGFFANMFRESMHILLYPFIAKRGLGVPAVAMGGATSMDTGLPVIIVYGGSEAAIIGMVQGIAITLSAPFVLSITLGAG
ncbi:hypothetical protein PYJP_07540 [Pyrofollis japonicus]|uniref:lysine exporter LysO family protein n=1 Tax=Pyrofollis japonicus TaxID=3060460 RepID=UPI00295BF3C1|nr:lysine exporter LysO family protein [Pyrofollis japonicus]BEP17402.1 hypothetical protein PYJP_07540 [Pyrofollis japonicus]